MLDNVGNDTDIQRFEQGIRHKNVTDGTAQSVPG